MVNWLQIPGSPLKSWAGFLRQSHDQEILLFPLRPSIIPFTINRIFFRSFLPLLTVLPHPNTSGHSPQLTVRNAERRFEARLEHCPSNERPCRPAERPTYMCVLHTKPDHRYPPRLTKKRTQFGTGFGITALPIQLTLQCVRFGC
jgi:hypothetical protein